MDSIIPINNIKMQYILVDILFGGFVNNMRRVRIVNDFNIETWSFIDYKFVPIAQVYLSSGIKWK